MKFNRGNIVKFTDTFWGGDLDEPKDDIGKLGVIEYSYGERYGNGENDGEYSVIDLETGGSSAWWSENKLEFVSEGGEDVITECRNKYEKLNEMMSDLNWIKTNWDSVKNGASGTTILTLLNEIGYESSFKRNGEFFVLESNWITFFPIFDNVFNDNLEEAIKNIKNIFKHEYVENYKNNVITFYNKIHAMK